MTKKKIICDIDGVLAQFHPHFTQYVNDKLGTDYDSSEIQGWQLGDLPVQEVKKLHDEFVKDGKYRDMPTYENINLGLELISYKRDLILCTSRHPSIKDDTKAWLKDKGLSGYDLWMRDGDVKDDIFKGDYKVGLCLKHKIGEIIEDNIETLVLASQEGITSFGVARPHNRIALDSEMLRGTKLIKVYGVEGVADYLEHPR